MLFITYIYIIPAWYVNIGILEPTED